MVSILVIKSTLSAAAFGVVHNFEAGDITSLEITSALSKFDPSNYPNGTTVTLSSQSPGGGAYTSARHTGGKIQQ